MDELTLSSMSIQAMVSPTLDEVAREIQIWRPEIVYFCSYNISQAEKNLMVGPLAFEVMILSNRAIIIPALALRYWKTDFCAPPLFPFLFFLFCRATTSVRESQFIKRIWL